MDELKKTKENIAVYVKKWKTQGKNQKDLVLLVNHFCEKNKLPNSKISTTVLSRILNNSEDVNEKRYYDLWRILQKIEESSTEIDTPEKIEKTDFKHLIGFFEVYHKTKYGGNILKNILEITDEGKAIMQAENQEKHFGEVRIFQNSMVALNFYSIENRPFYYQILFNLKGYLEYGLEKVSHIWATSTTVSLEMLPMANIRLIFPIHSQVKNPTDLPSNIDMNSPEFQEIIEKKPALKIFQNDIPTRLIADYEINESPE